MNPRHSMLIRNHFVCGPMLCGLILAIMLVAGCTNPGSGLMAGEGLESPAKPDSGQPNLARGADGTVILSWLEPYAKGVALRFSILGIQGWGPATTVAHGDDWVVNWADFPSVVPITDSFWAAHWLTRNNRSAYAYDISMALSDDAGESWSQTFSPHTDGTLTEHGFVSLFASQDGAAALWLDGRAMASDGGRMALRAADISHGQLLSAQHIVDADVCDCCQTDVTMGPKGPIAVYRDRSDNDIRDINVIRRMDGVWQSGQRLADDGWKISGCPVNGPAIDARGAKVAVAWFTGADDKPRVRLARSSDGAATFAAPINISEIRPMGRVDVISLDDGGAVVSWLRRSTPQEAELCVRAVAADGSLGPVQVVARTTTTRPSGFPKMQLYGNGLILAWTDTTQNVSEVRTARVRLGH
jgi:hypothetical protein